MLPGTSGFGPQRFRAFVAAPSKRYWKRAWGGRGPAGELKWVEMLAGNWMDELGNW
jgi:hypothetical protein